MKHVLIIGGAGFIGTHLTKACLSRGYRVRILDSFSEQIHGNNPDKESYSDNLEIITGDIRDISIVRKALVDIDSVFHLAAETGTGQSMYEIRRYVDINELGTAVILECIGELKNKCLDVVLTSSRSIYGEGEYTDDKSDVFYPAPRLLSQLSRSDWDFKSDTGELLQPVPHNENTNFSPGSIYASTKISQELLVGVACSAMGIRSSILRLQNVYGVGQSLRNPYTGLISIFYNRLRQGLPLNIFEDGLESRDFVYVTDVVSALINCIERCNQNNIIVDIGSGVRTSIIDLAQKLVSIAKNDTQIQITGEFRVGDIRHGFADISNAEEVLGFSPEISLNDGLKLFCDWASTQPIFKDLSDEAKNELAQKGFS